jgi:hypothetical protein
MVTGRLSQAAEKLSLKRGFGKGTTSVVPLSRRKRARALAPEVSFLRLRLVFPQPVSSALVAASEPATGYRR